MDHLVKICATSILLGACIAPAASADETEYTKFVEGALSVYKQFEEPSVKESNKFLSFVNSRWKAANGMCISSTCTIDGQSAAKAYATTYKVKISED